MTGADLVAVMAFQGGSVRVLQDFTDDRGRLLRVIETLLVGEDENASVDPATSADSEFDIFFTDRQLSALQTAVAMLGRLPEKKASVYFASGLRLNGTNNQAQLQATINAAVRAGVEFWPITARGWVASAPIGDATQGRGYGERTTGELTTVRTRYGHWRPIPAEKRCWTRTTSARESCRRRKRPGVTTSSAFTRPTRRQTVSCGR